MKYSIVILSFVAAVTALPFHDEQHRNRRDVSEIVDAKPANIYLPPVGPQNIYIPPAEPQKVEEPTVYENELPIAGVTDEPAVTETIDVATEAVPETAVLGENGYEYRTIRRLRLRQRRDVSHLNLEYLPPVGEPNLELNYLPPHLDVPQPMAQLKVSNEYLPPMNEKIVLKEQTTEAMETEVPETTAAAPEATTAEVSSTEVITTEAPTTQSPTTEATTTSEATTTGAPTPSPTLKEVTHEETAILAEDGYHYKKPSVLPDLGEVPLQNLAAPELASQPELEAVLVDIPEPELAYLPPLVNGMVEVEAPVEDTAPLLDDGYHYRVVKQVRLF